MCKYKVNHILLTRSLLIGQNSLPTFIPSRCYRSGTSARFAYSESENHVSMAKLSLLFSASASFHNNKAYICPTGMVYKLEGWHTERWLT